jgi:hypothetical protein
VRKLTVDLHGHDVLTAVDLAWRRVSEAYANGYGTVELLHGAGDVTEPVETGRGRIKWALRSAVDRGEFDSFIERGQTWLKAGSIVLTLKRNSRPRSERWADEPHKRYR